MNVPSVWDKREEFQEMKNNTVEKWNIRFYHECEGRIDKSVPRINSVPRIDVWHHEACLLVMTNGDPEVRIFLSYPHTNN